MKAYDLYASKISLEEEELFLAQDFSQQDAILRALKLHLSICSNCVKRSTYEYLLNTKLETMPQLYMPFKKSTMTTQ